MFCQPLCRTYTGTFLDKIDSTSHARLCDIRTRINTKLRPPPPLPSAQVTTHVVAANPQTDKALTALKEGKHVVAPDWL